MDEAKSERDKAIAELQALVTEGIESGATKAFDTEEFLAEMRAKLRSKYTKN